MNNNQQFLDRVKIEREELQEDLIGLPTNNFNKVGDFGCGWGYITWSLAQEMPMSDCIGVDRFDPEDPPTLDSRYHLENVQNLYKQINSEKNPKFIKGDIVSGKNLPQDFDLIYCKRVLYNIFSKSSEKELSQAINHIAQALKSNGWFCLIEINDPIFKTILEEILAQVNFEFKPARCLHRQYSAFLEIFDKHPYLVYQCKKV